MDYLTREYTKVIISIHKYGIECKWSHSYSQFIDSPFLYTI